MVSSAMPKIIAMTKCHRMTVLQFVFRGTYLTKMSLKPMKVTELQKFKLSHSHFGKALGRGPKSAEKGGDVSLHISSLK